MEGAALIESGILDSSVETTPVITDWWYQSGDLFFPKAWIKALETPIIGHYNTAIYVNYWSLMHLLVGVLWGIGASYFEIDHIYAVGFILHTVWELWQVIIGMSTPWILTGHNGFTDLVLDTGFFMLGVYIGVLWK